MTSSSSAPKLPFWVFAVTYVALLAAAYLVGSMSPRPWSETVIVSLVVLVLAAAAVLLIPLVARYERQKNEALDDRQRALEALARTLSSSAEQISIAAGGLHDMAELSQKNLRHAEQLPHKLQEKIAEFQAQLSNANDVEKEELEKELEELRSSESERLQSISDRIAKTTAEFAKLESATHQHVSAASDALSKLAAGTTAGISKAQAAAEQALEHARKEATRAFGEATAQSVKSIEEARSAALAALSARVDGQVGRIEDTIARLTTTIEKLQAVAATPIPAPAIVAQPTEPAAIPEGAVPPAADAAVAPTLPDQPSSPAGAAPNEPAAEPSPAPAKKARKPRREEPAETPAATPPVAEPTPALAASDDVAAAPVEAPAAAWEPSVSTREEATTAAPETKETAPAASPLPEPPALSPHGAAPTPEQPVSSDSAPVAEAPKAPRKRAARKHDDDQPGLGLALFDESSSGAEPANGDSGVMERVLTSDGATRLIVTAYIGIGNRLFIRGSGPGLSWEKGVPLQFVSIGKWRWETNEASAPVQFKLLKNDEQETVGLGQLTIEPGHQHEVTAAF